MEMKAVHFTYYVHDTLVPPGVTTVVVAGANASLTGPSALGDISVFDSVLRKTASNASAQVGHSSGQLVSLNDPAEKLIILVQDITISGYSGTISASGRFNFSTLSWELGVSSGTASFRGAMGYLRPTIVALDPVFPVVKSFSAIAILLTHKDRTFMV
ncbi:hypothetical protein AXG93_441s1020 [Marchantia polymorpha subsp. ruderalis]|uniref:Dirigent protein n=1 Tax=Marchantia polymorpha subsp. ruderalis TaxID=1480154 RepID=A0A176W468_MARPO|nr:hypothetical protein AXG93_441s1020 [Marchantia polymorpha subsp. ruderalis]